MHLRSIITVTLLTFTLAATAQLFPNLSGQPLLDAIAQAYTPDTTMSYGTARDTMYARIYNQNDSVRCVYSGHQLYLPPGEDPSIALYMNGSNDGINTEHTWPQSLGAGDGNARRDLHHLFPTRTSVNAARANFPFAEIPDNQTTQWYYLTTQMPNIPQTNIDLYSERVNGQFEPREDHKGNVARAMFYFYTIYHTEATSIDPDFFPSQQETLCQWHYLDPADSLEIHRSQLIAHYQDGKPNPFVIDCTLAARSYCPDTPGDCPDPPPTATTSARNASPVLLHPNPVTDTFTLQSGAIRGHLTITDLNGKPILQKTWATGELIAVQHLPAGTYFLFLKTATMIHAQRLIKI